MNLGGGQTVKSLPMMSSSASWKSTDSLSDTFPAGLRVLLVDDDPTCLMILEKMLENCLYEVTTINRAEIALSLLQKNKNGYDIVISDVHMPDMDGFKLLECVGLEMDLPVIMMSADDSKSVVMNGVTHGACDYLIKPVRMEALKNIWQHVVRKRKHEWKDFEPVGSAEDGDRQQKPAEDAEYSCSANEGNWKSSKRKKDEEDETEEREDSSTLKKPRVVWSVELHQQFVAAVNQLGIDKAVPKKILELMNIPGLTRENVASHLQKYRLYLRRISGVSQQQSGLNNSFMGTPDANFVPLSSFNGLDFQALSATGQIPAQGLATLQAAALGRSTSKSISIPLVDQRNLFSFETPKVGFREGQQQLDNNGKQINLLHEIPTNMEPKHLSNLHQYVPSYGDINMHVNSLGTQSSSLPLQMAQSQSRTQILNETNNGNLSRLSSSVVQSVVPNEIGIGVSGHNVMVDRVRGTVYNQVSHPSPMEPMVDFSMNHCADLRGSSFPLGSNPGMTTSSSKGVLQEEVSSKMKGSIGYLPSYDIFGGFQQHVSQEWNSQNVRRSFDASQHANANIQGPLNISRSVHPGLYSNQRDIQNKDMYTGKEVFSTGEQSACVKTSNANQQLSALVSGNLQRVKAENLPNTRAQKTLLPQQFGQDDLMSALLKLQERIGPVESEYCFDGYHLDNLPV